jgi:hemerythrin-like metal-binding protein
MKAAKAKDTAGSQPASAVKKNDEVPDIGVAEIDDAHHRLVAHYRTLLAMLKRHHDTHEFALMYHIFIHRMRRHFEREDRFLEEIGYDDRDHHRLLHRKLMRDAEDFLVDLVRRSDKAEAVAVTTYLEHCMINHTTTHDRKIGEFLANRVWPA